MRVLLTGGAGFIGSHLAEAYVDRGDEVLILDDFSTGHRRNIPDGVEVIEGDIRDARSLLKDAGSFDLLSHHAAQASVVVSVADPLLDASINLLGGVALLHALEGRVGGITFASTGGAIYGEVPSEPATEDNELRPESPYGAAKAAFEILLGAWSLRTGIPATILRYGNVYGPRQDPHGEAGVVAIFSQRLNQGKDCTIFGDGSAERDYIFVEDVVRANLSSYGVKGVFNIGTGRATSTQEIYEGLSGRGASPPIFAPGREGELDRSVLNAHKAKSSFDWVATKDLESGLVETRHAFGTE
ncbi:NAD-dependent epimerase/dehydratase family protein [bacterium]|nr:NAD-dependent epimerase/dehydratase family protein [bacterium]